MKNIFLSLLFLTSVAFGVDVKISQLPLAAGSSIATNDSFPFVVATNLTTKRMTIFDIVNVPLFVATYAPIANPTFTGTVTAPHFVGPLTGAVTGTASGNTTYTANNHGVVISSATNAMTVLAPNASTSFPLVSGGASANPSWALLSIAGGGTGQSSFSSGILHSNGSVLSSSAISLTADVSGILPLANGGTNKAMTASAGSVAYSDSDSLEFTSVGSNGQHLQSAGTGTPAWTTATFPSTATGTGTILRANGTNWLASTATYPDTTTANQILYSSSTSVIGQITTAATSALVTNSSSVPSLTSGSTANRVLRTDGATVSFAQVAAATDISGTLPIANGGTNNASLSVTGGTVYYGDGTKLVGLANGSSGQFLKSNGTTVAPSWAAATVPLTAATVQIKTVGSGNYTTPAGVLYIVVRMSGGGGGGGGSTASSNGSNSTFGTALTANGGIGGATNALGGVGGGFTVTASGTVIDNGSFTGSGGSSGATGVNAGGNGGSSQFGGGGIGGVAAIGNGQAAVTGTGSGGGGAATASGGGSGGNVNAVIYPTASQVFAYVAGAGGAGGTSAGAGAAGQIIIDEYYQ